MLRATLVAIVLSPRRRLDFTHVCVIAPVLIFALPDMLFRRHVDAKKSNRHPTARVCSRSQQQQLHLYDLHDQVLPYDVAWRWQKQYVAALADSRRAGSPIAQALAVVQHEPTYTLGAGSSLEHIKFDPESPPHPLYRTERGGEVTYHGPGQLVLYPILDLRQHGQDLHRYLRDLEQVVIGALNEVSGILAHRKHGLTGAYILTLDQL